MEVQILLQNQQEWNNDWEDLVEHLIDPQRMMEICIDGANIFANAWRLKEIVHNKTGQYQRAIHVVPVQASDGLAEVVVQTEGLPTPYDFYLEYGTSTTHARPIMRPAYDASQEKVQQRLEDGLFALNLLEGAA